MPKFAQSQNKTKKNLNLYTYKLGFNYRKSIEPCVIFLNFSLLLLKSNKSIYFLIDFKIKIFLLTLK